MSFQEGVFPLEIWAEIMEYCAQRTLLDLSQVSPMCCEEARKVLFRNTVMTRQFDVNSVDLYDHDKGPITTIHKPWEFFEMLKRDKTNWRQKIRSAGLEWFWEYTNNEGRDIRAGRNKPVPDHLIFKIAALLSECTQLEHFHLDSRTLPVATAMLNLQGITSLDFSIPYMFSWKELFRVFEVSTLTTLTVRNLLSPDWPTFRLPPPIPDELHLQSAISNVRELTLRECGPLTLAILPVFQWPKSLQKLCYLPSRSKCEPHWRGILRRTGDISDAVDQSFEVLRPLRESVKNVEFDLGLDRHWISPFKTHSLFQPFDVLTKLAAPVELLMYSRGLSSPRFDEPFYTRLPRSLQDLTLKFFAQLPWHSQSAEKPKEPQICSSDDPAFKLFEELSTLALHKKEYFPDLQRLTLMGDGGQDSISKCGHAEDSFRVLEKEGVTVVEAEWCRKPKEVALLQNTFDM